MFFLQLAACCLYFIVLMPVVISCVYLDNGFCCQMPFMTSTLIAKLVILRFSN